MIIREPGVMSFEEALAIPEKLASIGVGVRRSAAGRFSPLLDAWLPCRGYPDPGP